MNHRDLQILKSFIIEETKNYFRDDWWAISFDKRLFDDESIQYRSVIVPDDIKDHIKKWLHDMKLS